MTVFRALIMVINKELKVKKTGRVILDSDALMLEKKETVIIVEGAAHLALNKSLSNTEGLYSNTVGL